MLRATLIVVTAFAVVSLLLTWSRALARRGWAAAGHALLTLLAAGVATWAWPLLRNMETYSIQPADAAVADVYCEQTAAQRYRVTLTRLPDGRMQVFDVSGDEWRVEVRMLAWTERVDAFGPAPRYRLERLTTRAQGQAGAPLSSFELAAARGRDVWRMARSGEPWSSLMVASSPEPGWQPLADGARFTVRLDAARVAVIPLNAAASESLAAGG